MPAFLLATLIPVPLLITATAMGGWVGWATLGYLTLFTALLDQILPRNWSNDDPGAAHVSGAGLSVALGVLHLFLIVIAMRLVGGPGGVAGWDIVPVALAYGIYFGQVSHPNAHELIHRPGQQSRQLGRMVYTSMLFGHHASSHPKIHHVYVASRYDPNTAMLGEGFWRYLRRAWIGSFIEGARIERFDLKRGGRSWHAHPYGGYVLGAAGLLLLAYGFGGWTGVAAYVAICFFAQVQILLSDYVQHYGLERDQTAEGRLLPVGPEHSWNAPHRWTSAMMLNAPRHSDHHMHPGRVYPALQLDRRDMPMLPRSLPVMATVALFPGWWRRVMDPRVAQWQQRGLTGARPGTAALRAADREAPQDQDSGEALPPLRGAGI
ncbi:alkane 1-monooxygenase [Pseudooceanicola aestuarii]|uniref:alkane 1-monooxygenase n=1 Tax=Pseudooceanicola aestuarii TaxID=2697319 RepID=UPI0013D335B9|nr:alkane 1-monooxygenase [Pseudooceanicola aestuarii]